MAAHNFNSNDLASPGYEFLRSYRSMSNLYYKLIALNYQLEFCPLYKCPPVHRYYFAFNSNNQVEQQFSFMCLCVWLLKDKCQMNFDTDPRDYQDLDSTVSVIYEAMKLLLVTDGDDKASQAVDLNLFPLGRLKQGFGPEVIFCLNKFADRALELVVDGDRRIGPADISYQNKQKSNRDQGRQPNSIIIGQPIVGGGLTTRPLGNYQIDDSSLILGYKGDNSDDNDEKAKSEAFMSADNSEWNLEKLNEIAPLFAMDFSQESTSFDDWQPSLDLVKRSRIGVQNFSTQSRPILEAVAHRIEHQMKTLSTRKSAITTNLKTQLETFLDAWRKYSAQSKRNSELSEMINFKTDTFESYVVQLNELRTKKTKFNDKSKLRQLDRMVKSLGRETDNLDIKLGLLLAANCSRAASQAVTTTARH